MLNGRVGNERSDAKSTVIFLIRVNRCQLSGRCASLHLWLKVWLLLFQFRSWKWSPVIKNLWRGAGLSFAVQWFKWCSVIWTISMKHSSSFIITEEQITDQLSSFMADFRKILWVSLMMSALDLNYFLKSKSITTYPLNLISED